MEELTDSSLSVNDVCHEKESSTLQNEIKAVEESFQSETCQVNFCRYFLTMALWATTIALSVITNKSLSDKEEVIFQNAYNQISNTVGKAVMDHQDSAEVGMHSLSESVTMDSLQSSSEWPYYAFPFYTNQADNVRAQTGLEFLMASNLVEPIQVQNYFEFIVDGHKQISDGAKEGSATELVMNETYSPFIPSERAGDPKQYNSSSQIYGLVWGISSAAESFTGDTAMSFDILSISEVEAAFEVVRLLQTETFFNSTDLDRGLTKGMLGDHNNTFENAKAKSPHTFIMSPIRENLDASARIVGIQIAAFSWENTLSSILTKGLRGLFVVLSSTCGQISTYTISGGGVLYLGEGDIHERDYDDFKRTFDLSSTARNGGPSDIAGQCLYAIDLYPTFELRKEFITDTPSSTASNVAITLAAIILVFFLYDLVVQRRNARMIESAAQSSAVVSDMFPGTIGNKYILQDTNKRMRSFLDKDRGHTEELALSEKAPLAELFLETTVMFADIAGFTSWSSAREPAQVFMLLESIFGEFDELAKPRRIFKVETVGDCYVAVAGVPDFRRDHAIAMARFAREVVTSFQATTRKLDVVLGPDTSELGLRVGLHSGPVTAGILRGDRARFQLFGDTMNTCSRIETTSESGRIQISRDTADLLKMAGKHAWLLPRQEMVTAKGKGQMETFWLCDNKDDGEETESHGNLDNSGSTHSDDLFFDHKIDRLIEWNTDTLKRYLIEIIVRRRSLPGAKVVLDNVAIERKHKAMSDNFLDEVKDSIRLPEFVLPEVISETKSSDIDPKIEQQLREYVASIASMYRDNAFHNFEHASHVTMSVTKLLSRIVAPSDLELDMDSIAEQSQEGRRASEIKITQTLHDHTYGITSDPLTQFACAFSALIHDVDHRGIPNTRLVVEDPALGERFRNRSVAEQNSLSIAWDLLLEPRFKYLRAAIFDSPEELVRFRELVVNCVMATDIVDKDLKELRNERWNKAFMNARQDDGGSRLTVNRRATIVIEHLLQASDISHTMQHWHVYRKWNENLFRELFMAYKAGRSNVNPALNWAKSEIGFFDFYILPLAKKLKDCGVFGISSAEFLNYAKQNREEWLHRGEEIVAQMVSHYETEFASVPLARVHDAVSCEEVSSETVSVSRDKI